MSEPRRELVILGAGGHAKVVADIVRLGGKYCLVGFTDDQEPSRHGERFCGSSVIGGRDVLPRLAALGTRCAFVAIGNAEARLALAAVAERTGFELPLLRHPSAVLAGDAEVGSGCLLAAGAIVNSGATLGAQVIVNTAASVDHDCHLEEAVHVAPGAHLGGHVVVGRGAWIGIGATVKDGVRIGAGAMVGAGAVVVDDLPERVIAYGVPARVIRNV